MIKKISHPISMVKKYIIEMPYNVPIGYCQSGIDVLYMKQASAWVYK